jgi:hypothetical protein
MSVSPHHNQSTNLHTYGGVWERRYSPYSFMTSVPDADEWSASHPGCAFTPRQGTYTHWTQGWWALEPVWTHKLEEKSSCLCWGSNHDRLVIQSVAKHYTDWATPASSLVSSHLKNYLSAQLYNFPEMNYRYKMSVYCSCQPFPYMSHF